MNKEYWTQRYQQNKTGWDIGSVSTPIKEFIDQLQNKDLKILIPGAGNAYEAEYLFKQDFKNTYICDVAPQPISNFKKRSPHFPNAQILQEDFFQLDHKFDLILEQTFFCAIPIKKRGLYAKKTSELLKLNGVLAGLLFDFPLTTDGPPFGGTKKEYLTYFSPYYHIGIIETAYNSIKPRQGNELFFKFTKK